MLRPILGLALLGGVASQSVSMFDTALAGVQHIQSATRVAIAQAEAVANGRLRFDAADVLANPSRYFPRPSGQLARADRGLRAQLDAAGGMSPYAVRMTR